MKKLSLIIVLFTCLFMSNIYAQANIVIPNIVRESFKKDFPKETPTWTKDFGGDDLDEIRYEAKFKTNTTEGLAVYDNLGNLKAYEVLIQEKDIPLNAIHYLKSKYANITISEASKVKNDKNETTYEVGIIRAGKFYDAVFDHNGDFLEIIQKD